MFIDNICSLTGEKIEPKDTDIDIPAKYSMLFGNKHEKPRVSLNDIANIVDSILLRKEEYGNANLDKWGRFDHNKSFLVQKQLDQSPIIDELLLDVIGQLGLKAKTIWPDERKGAVCLTHDVDLFEGRSYLFLRKMLWLYHAGSALIKGQKDTYRNYLNKIKRWSDPNYDPIHAFDNWMQLEKRYGFRSTFFFFGLRHALSIEGRLYSYRDQRVRDTLKKLDENGWEIGLHAGYYNHLYLNYLKKQKAYLEDALGKEIIGCRHHFLRVRFPQSWDLYAKAGFKYSSNVGWGQGYNGFRAGTCLPYIPSDVDGTGQISLCEIPLQLMDRSSIANPKDYFELFKDFLEKVKKVGGCLVLDFHQEYFDQIESPGTNETYEMILELLSADHELWVAPLEEVYTHFHSLSE